MIDKNTRDTVAIFIGLGIAFVAIFFTGVIVILLS